MILTYLKHQSKAVRNLLGQTYPIEAALHVASIPGPELLRPYQRFKSRNGILKREVEGNAMYLDPHDEGISRTLARWGTREEQAVAELRRQLTRLKTETDGDITVIECGANIGYYAFIESAELGGRADIYAVEPDPRNIDFLQRGIAANGFGNRVRVIRSGFGSENREATLNRSTRSNCSRVDAEPEFGQTAESITVELQRVDDFLENYGLQPSDIDVLRMDVEGYENEILEGMPSLLAADSDLVIFVEIHRRLHEKGELEWVVTTLRSAGFDLTLAVCEPQLQDATFLPDWDSLYEVDWDEKENIELILTR